MSTNYSNTKQFMWKLWIKIPTYRKFEEILKVNFAPTLINYFLKYSLSQKVDYNLGNIYSSWKVAQMNLTSLRSNPLYATANLVTNTVVVGENLNLNTLILRYFSHYCFFV